MQGIVYNADTVLDQKRQNFEIIKGAFGYQFPRHGLVETYYLSNVET